MSVVAALVQDKTVYMGADSLVSSGDDTFIRSHPPKVFDWKDFAMGVCGSLRVGDIVYAVFEPPARGSYPDAFTYMVQSFVPRLRQCLREQGLAIDPSGGSDSIPEEFDMIVGFRGNLFTVDSSFSVAVPAEGYTAIGSGASWALGSLYTTRHWRRGKDRVTRAVEASIHYCASVGGPFVGVEK